jgi:hypothetical protein
MYQSGGGTILKYNLDEQGVGLWAGIIRLGIGTGGVFL